MYELECRVCKGKLIANTLSGIVTVYLLHSVGEHWDLVEEMHNSPSMIQDALELAAHNEWI